MGCSEVSTKSDAYSILKTKEYSSIKGAEIQDPTDFEWKAETVADLGLYRYQIPASSWNNLDVQKRTYVYYLGQAGLAGRDMMWDQNYRHNLEIREALEAVYTNSSDKSSEAFIALQEYTKRVWFSNGIHHHYSMMKFMPEFTRTWFEEALQ